MPSRATRKARGLRSRRRRLARFSADKRQVSAIHPTTTAQITISDSIAQEAAAEGLLEPGAIEAILHERLVAARVALMQATRQKLSATGRPPMTAEEIEAEIKAYRAERRRAAGA